MGETKTTERGTRIVPTGACYDCGGRCVLKVHVKDGVAVRVETDDGEEPQLRACARGRAYRRQVYAPDRLLYPLKRVGERGRGEFKRVSWDEALDTVAGELQRAKEAYGPRSILLHVYSGQNTGTFHGGYSTICQLLRDFGGYTATWGGASAEGSVFASRATFGTLSTGSHPRRSGELQTDPTVGSESGHLDLRHQYQLLPDKSQGSRRPDRCGRSQVH